MAASRTRSSIRWLGALALLAIALLVAFASGGASDRSGGVDGPVSGPAASVEEILRVDGTALILGRDDAPAKVLIFEDFSCPFCRQLEQEVAADLEARALDGTIRVEFRPVSVLGGPYSEPALRAWSSVLLNDTPKAAYDLHNLLYERQPGAEGGVSDLDHIADLVAEAGGDRAAAIAAMADHDRTFLDAAAAPAMERRLTGVPTVFLNEQQIGGDSIPAMADMLRGWIDAVLQGSQT